MAANVGYYVVIQAGYRWNSTQRPKNSKYYPAKNEESPYGFLPLKTDTCIEFLDYGTLTTYAIDIDEDDLPEVRKVLDEQLVRYGQSVEGLLEEAAQKGCED